MLRALGAQVSHVGLHTIINECMLTLIVVVVYIWMVISGLLPMPQVSQRTISFGLSESSFLHLIHIISVVVSSTVCVCVCVCVCVYV